MITSDRCKRKKIEVKLMSKMYDDFFKREMTKDELECLIRFEKLNRDNQIKVQAFMIELDEMQKVKKS